MVAALDRLEDGVRFGVVSYDGRQTYGFRRKLQRRTDASGDQVRKWAKRLGSSGSGDPIAALRLAVGYRPDLIYFAAQDLYNPGRAPLEEQRGQMLADFLELPLKRAPVSTVEVKQVDPTAADGRRSLLHEMAVRTDGRYRFATIVA